MRFATKSMAGAALASGLLLTAGLAPAHAQQQSGLVNVNVSHITIGDVLSENNVNVGVAALLVANVCPSVTVGNVAVLAAQAARSGSATAVCTATGDTIEFTQAAG